MDLRALKGAFIEFSDVVYVVEHVLTDSRSFTYVKTRPMTLEEKVYQKLTGKIDYKTSVKYSKKSYISNGALEHQVSPI